MVANVRSVASTERRDIYPSSTTARVPLPRLAPNSRRRARGFVQLDVYAALTVATAVLTSTVAAQTPIGCSLMTTRRRECNERRRSTSRSCNGNGLRALASAA